MTTNTTTLYSVSLADIALAFQKWEESYRVCPTQFLSKEGTAALSVDEVSAQRAEYFLALLHEGGVE